MPVRELVLLPPLLDAGGELLDAIVDDPVPLEGGAEGELGHDDGAIVPLDLVAMGMAADTFRPATCRGITIMWDHYSHSSGVQRGYIRCPGHDACFRYAQVNTFPTRSRLAAYLFAWRSLGADGQISRESHQSRDCKPSEAQIALVEPDVRL